MTYFVTLEADNQIVSELFNDSTLAPPAGAVAITDEEGELLRHQSRFGEWELVGVAIRQKAIYP